MHSRAALLPISEDYNPSWPPMEQQKPRGKATRVIDVVSEHNSNERNHSGSGHFLPRADVDPVIGPRVADAANLMSHAPSALTRLVARTVDDNESWSPGKRKVAGPQSDVGHQGFNVVRPEPLEIRAKRRRGCANSQTTAIIAEEIHKRDAARERDAALAEKNHSFHSFFSEQPKAGKGTAHVRPPWEGGLPPQHHQQQQQQQFQPRGNTPTPAMNSSTMSTNMNSSSGNYMSGAAASSLRFSHTPQPSSNIINNGNTLENSRSRPILAPMNNESSVNRSSNNLSSSVVQADPPGLPGVGHADQFRQQRRHAGKRQISGAHQLTSFVDDGRNRNNNNSQMQQHNNMNSQSGSGDFHQKIPDGSRGLRISAPQRDSIRDAFESNPEPLHGKAKHQTTSSTWGQPGLSDELKAFVAGSTRQGPNTRHFQPSGAAYPPIGAPSAAFRSSTPLSFQQQSQRR